MQQGHLKAAPGGGSARAPTGKASGSAIAFADPRMRIAPPPEGVFVLDAETDGFDQIAEILTALEVADLSSLQLFCHRAAGCIFLGGTLLTPPHLMLARTALAAIGSSLAAHGAIVLHGLDSGKAGRHRLMTGSLAHGTGRTIRLGSNEPD